MNYLQDLSSHRQECQDRIIAHAGGERSDG